MKGKHREQTPSLFDRAAKRLPFRSKSKKEGAKRRTAPAAAAAILAVALVLVLTLVSYAQLVMVNDQAVNLR